MKSIASINAGLLILFFLSGLAFIRANSQTYDEAMSLAAGYSYLTTGDFRIQPQEPPLIKELLALPLFAAYGLPFTPDPKQWRQGDGYLIGEKLLYESTLPADRILFLSRVPNLFLGTLIVALASWWAYRLWGSSAATLAIALAAFEPNLVAHSSLVTTDAGVTLFMFLAVYLLWECLNSSNRRLAAAAGVSVGLALVSKNSGIILIPLVVAIVVAAVFMTGPGASLFLLRRREVRVRERLVDAAAVIGIVLVFALPVIPLAYFFHGLHVWFSGLQVFLRLARAGQAAFFFGNYSYFGWWYYFVVAFLIKTPIGTLFLIAASLVLFRKGRPLGRRDALFLLLPVLTLFVVTAMAKVNLGVRHVLPVYPFLFVVASRMATIRFQKRFVRPLLIGIPLVFTAVSSLHVAPHQLAYFNEFAWGPGGGYRYLSDSNIDWGQDLQGVKAYMDRERLPIIYLSYFGTAPPSYYGIRYQYAPGTWPLDWPPPPDKVPADARRKILAISVFNLQDVSYMYTPLYKWLWSRKPVDTIGWSIFVYDLTHDPEGLRRLEEAAVTAGVP